MGYNHVLIIRLID